MVEPSAHGKVSGRNCMQVQCDLGTDCTDCGPWKFTAAGAASSFQADLPVKRLTSQNVRIIAPPPNRSFGCIMRQLCNRQ